MYDGDMAFDTEGFLRRCVTSLVTLEGREGHPL